jgi:Flp pilus assembly protein TadD
MTGASDPTGPMREDVVAAAQRHLQSGRLDDAEALLKDVLTRDPSDADALCAMGALALSRRRLDHAFQILSHAATMHPAHAGLANNLGIAHQLSGRLDEAIICFERAVGLADDIAAPLLSLANAQFSAGQLGAALQAAQRLIELRPDDAATFAMLGAVLFALGEPAAEACFERCLTLEPDDPQTLQRVAVFLLDRGRFDEAVRVAEQARLNAPLDLEIQLSLARGHAGRGAFEAAEAVLKRVLAAAPAHRAAKELQARVRISLGRTEEALAELSRLVKSAPRDVEAVLVLAAALRFAGRFDQAIAMAEHARKLAPDDERAERLNVELRLATGQALDAPAPPASDTVLVPEAMSAAELILLSRFITTADGETRDVLVSAGHRPLVARLTPPPRLVEDAQSAVALPALLGAAAEPGVSAARIPYLAPAEHERVRWAAALAEHPRPVIGLIWDDNPLSVPLAVLREILPRHGTIVSLAVGPPRHALRDWPQAMDAGAHLVDLDDLIALIDQLDAVVGPDHPALHIAGALGRPGLALVPAGPPWYWAARDGRAVWYPSIRVIRQRSVGLWDDVSAPASMVLAELASAAQRDPAASETESGGMAAGTL